MEAKSPQQWVSGSSRWQLATDSQWIQYTMGSSSRQLWSERPPRYWPEFGSLCRTRTREPGSKTEPTFACQSTQRSDNRSRLIVRPVELLAALPEVEHYPVAGGPGFCTVRQSAGDTHSCECPEPTPKSGSHS